MIAPFPTELVTLLGSSLFGGIMRLAASAQESKRQERLLTIQALNAKMQHIEAARQFRGRGFQWTRRLIALTAVFFVVAFPKIVAVWMPETAVHVAYTQISEGFWFFSSDTEETRWLEMKGLVLTPLDTHLLSAVIGLYFGGSLANRT